MRGVPRVDGRSQEGRGARHDRLELLGLVKLQVSGETETVAQRGRQQAGARGSADDRERGQRQGNGGGAGSLANDHVDAEVFHRQVEHLLGGARQAVDLVNKEDVAFLQARQDCGQVARVLDGGAGGQAQRGPHLGGDLAFADQFAAGQGAGQDPLLHLAVGLLRR